MYATVDGEIRERLRAIVGEGNVLWQDDALEAYAHDETPGLHAMPEVVVKAGSTAEVSQVLRLANERRIAVTPRSGGTGLSGGAVPTLGGIVLSLERMDRILEIDRENLTVTAEPGVITGNLHRAVEQEGLFYPPDPASLDSCRLGGNIAENAGGPRAVKYGVTKDYVCGLQAVLPSGQVVRMGGKLVKNVTGYSLIQLLIGSEGTLAVVTEITLRLLPLPPFRVDLLAQFAEFEPAIRAVSDIIARRIVPTTIEFMERDSVLAAERLLGKTLPGRDAGACLLIQIDGRRDEDTYADMELVGDACLENGALDVLVARDRPTRDRLWEGRRAIIDALKQESPVSHMEDVVVPRAVIPRLVSGVHELAGREGVRAVCFGHAGDGNVHVIVLRDSLSEERWRQLVPVVQKGIYELTLLLGGTLTGEHGVGATRRAYLPLAVDPVLIDLQRRLKAVFDPNGILNPGKIFP
ncbi:MAG: FAD-linked oxidase C-terminal domain-containing protein [Anaerolineae bacterium]|nr:FAD-linked oxidase C-terminal domain-containing protein [Anaerolineae bacterium]